MTTSRKATMAKQSSDTISVKKNLLRSLAFKKLSGSGKYIYFQFLLKRIPQKKKSPRCKSGEWIILNEKELVFTYEEAQRKHGYSATKFTRAIDELIRLGFIDIEHFGGHAKGNYTLYGLSNRWERYGKPDFIEKERGKLKSKPGLRGFTDPKKNPCIQKRKSERS